MYIAKLAAPAVLQQSWPTSSMPTTGLSHVHTVRRRSPPWRIPKHRNSWHSRLVNPEDGRAEQGQVQMTRRKTTKDADYCMLMKVCRLCFLLGSCKRCTRRRIRYGGHGRRRTLASWRRAPVDKADAMVHAASKVGIESPAGPY